MHRYLPHQVKPLKKITGRVVRGFFSRAVPAVVYEIEAGGGEVPLPQRVPIPPPALQGMLPEQTV